MYDFIASRNWQQVTSNLRNDVVFDNRNKSYGAYQIRRDYDRNLILIMLGLLFSVGIISGAVHFLSGNTMLSKEVVIPTTEPGVLPPTEIMIEMKIEPKVKEDPKPSGNSGPTIENLPLVVTDEKDNESKSPTQDDLEKSKSGSSTTNPTVGGFGTGTEGAGSSGDDSPAVDEIVHDFTQYEAEFPGGTAALNKFLFSKIRYPEISIANGSQGKVFVRFVIGKDGAIENAIVVKGVVGAPELDAEALRVVKLMPKWKPAKHNGKVVKSYFNLPVHFQLE